MINAARTGSPSSEISRIRESAACSLAELSSPSAQKEKGRPSFLVTQANPLAVETYTRSNFVSSLCSVAENCSQRAKTAS